jgi:alanyl aminopeptidase
LGLEAKAGEDGDSSLFRASLVGALALLAEDDAVRAALVSRIENYLAADDLDPAAIDSGLVGTALTVAVADKDPAFAQNLLDRALASRDATFRQRALSALASAADDKVADMMRGIIGDPRLRDNEATMIAFTQSGEPAQREAIWTWMQSNMDVLLPRIPTWRKGAIVNMGAGFCSTERANEVDAFFQNKVEDLEGGPRELAQTVERITLCAALLAEKGPEVDAYFAAR